MRRRKSGRPHRKLYLNPHTEKGRRNITEHAEATNLALTPVNYNADPNAWAYQQFLLGVIAMQTREGDLADDRFKEIIEKIPDWKFGERNQDPSNPVYAAERRFIMRHPNYDFNVPLKRLEDLKESHKANGRLNNVK